MNISLRSWRLGLCCALLLFVLHPAGSAGEVTVRIGEQDTCKITGATTVASDKTGSQIKFDLSKLPKDAKILEAKLRLWVQPVGPFGIDRWNQKDFDGFKCFQVGKEDKPLDVCFPFEQAHYALQEWNVTAAAQEWAANPAANQGLKLDCPLPANDSQPAWRRPYLQVTYSGDPTDLPPPPADFKAFYRSGQVFMTWKQAPYDGAFFDQTFRVYMHSEPITPKNIVKAELLGEVNRNSQLNYRRTAYTWDGLGAYGCFGSAREYLKEKLPKDEKGQPVGAVPELQKTFQERYNFVIDDAWPEKSEGGKWITDIAALGEGRKILEGPQLADDEGLFVHTVKKAGSVYFAVTSVIEGQENRRDIKAGNTLAKPLEVKVEPTRPVLQMVCHGYGKGIRSEQYRVYTYWGGGDDGLHNAAATPFMLQVFTPIDYVSTQPRPTTTVQYGGASATLSGDIFYPPPTPRAPFPTVRVSLNADWGHWVPAWKFYHGSRKMPAEPGPEGAQIVNPELRLAGGLHSNYYGYHDRMNTGLDPRQATAVPYIENRILRELDMYLAMFPKADRNRIRVAAQRALMTFAMHHGDRIATASSAMDTPWTSKRAEGMWIFAGRKEWALKTPEGFNVWEWNDPVWFSKKSPLRDWPFITTCQSPNYDRGDDLYNWQDMGYPGFYKDLEKEKRGGWWWWAPIGDAPDGGGGFSQLNEAFPAFSSATCCQQPLPHWPDERAGTLSGYIEWHHADGLFVRIPEERHLQGKTAPAGGGTPYFIGNQLEWVPVPLDLVDEENRFEIALRIRNQGLTLNGPSVPACPVDFGMTDVTLRRLQKFKVEKGRNYGWKNVQVSTGLVLQSGKAGPDGNGLLTVPQVAVDRSTLGNKLIIAATDQPAPADPRSKMALQFGRKDNTVEKTELTLAEYLDKCRNPEMVKLVRSGRVFSIKDLSNGSASGDFYSEWGAGFGDAFQLPEAGRYRVDVSFRKGYKHAGAWPNINLSAALPDRQDVMIDSDQPKVYSWWIDMDAPGRRNIDFRLVNRCFNSPAPHFVMVDGKRMTRGFSVDSLTIVPPGKRPDKVSETYRVYVVTRSIETGLNVPVQLRAEVQDAWGEPLNKKPAWTVSDGAKISADGVFTAAKEGTYQVTAAADGKSDTVPVVVAGGAWVENFDDMYEDGWSTVYLGPPGKDEKGWNARSIHQYGRVYRDAGSADSALIWDGGCIWKDYSAQVDRLPATENRKTCPHSGLFFRYVDKDNYYRFEQDLAGKAFRLVKRVKGQETELGKAAKEAPRITVEGDEVPKYPTFRYYPAGTKYLANVKSWSFDRFRVDVKGDKITCSLNNVEVLSATDADLKAGTIGLFSDGFVIFDNVEVKVK